MLEVCRRGTQGTGKNKLKQIVLFVSDVQANPIPCVNYDLLSLLHFFAGVYVLEA